MNVKNTKVVTSLNPPTDTNVIWLCGTEFRMFVNGKWESIGGSGNVSQILNNPV